MGEREKLVVGTVVPDPKAEGRSLTGKVLASRYQSLAHRAVDAEREVDSLKARAEAAEKRVAELETWIAEARPYVERKVCPQDKCPGPECNSARRLLAALQEWQDKGDGRG